MPVGRLGRSRVLGRFRIHVFVFLILGSNLSLFLRQRESLDCTHTVLCVPSMIDLRDDLGQNSSLPVVGVADSSVMRRHLAFS